MKSNTFETPHPSHHHKVPEFKVILVGSSGVGKTCIVMRASKDLYPHQHAPTIGFAFQKLHKLIENIDAENTGQLTTQKLTLFLWDTAGQERYKSIIQMYYRGAHCAVIVYDVSSRESFESAEQLVEETKQNEHLTDCHFVLVGNKIDVEEEGFGVRQVSSQEGLELATKKGLDFAEVSARKSVGVHQLFEGIAKTMIVKHYKHIKRQQEEQQMKIMLSKGGEQEDGQGQSSSRGGCGGSCYLAGGS